MTSVRTRSLRAPASTGIGCLCCYLAAFGLPLLFLWGARTHIYPRYLVNTAPDCAAIGGKLLPFLPWQLLQPVPQGTDTASLQLAFTLRERNWLTLTGLTNLAAWTLTLLLQLIWRAGCLGRCGYTRMMRRAKRRGRVMLVLVLAVSLLCAAFLWRCGGNAIIGFGKWDLLCWFGIFFLLPPAAWITFRFAAPAGISGRHGYFKRL